MNAVDLPVALPWIAFAVSWLLFGVLLVTVHKFMQPWLNDFEAEQRSGLLFGLILLPVVAALLVAILGFAPGIGGLVVARHCHAGAGCSPHIPILHTGAAHAMTLVLGLCLATGAGICALFGRLRRSVMFGRTLDAIAEYPVQRLVGETDGISAIRSPQFKVINSGGRFAYCAGLLQPRLLVSRELLSVLSAAQLNAVLAHEQAHANRYDNLRRLLTTISLWPLPRTWSRAIGADLALTTEIVCDREAAARVGSADTVIDAISIMTRNPDRAVRSAESASTRALRGDSLSVHARIQALRGRAETRLSNSRLALLIGFAYAVVVLPSIYAAHHLAESLLNWLT
jgi:beta-lactamase regulating signal transducer with metallopeptidase domain